MREMNLEIESMRNINLEIESKISNQVKDKGIFLLRMDAAHVASSFLAFFSATIHSIVVLLGVIQNEITRIFKSVHAIKSCAGSIWHCVLEVADVTLKDSGCAVYAAVREHIT